MITNEQWDATNGESMTDAEIIEITGWVRNSEGGWNLPDGVFASDAYARRAAARIAAAYAPLDMPAPKESL